jgi:hypothetical protein
VQQQPSKLHYLMLLLKHQWHRVFGTAMAWFAWDILF